MLEGTGERYVPWLEDPDISYEHLHRYAYAMQFVQNKKVLDLACGEGYGSRLLARTAESVIGVDIDEQAIRHAGNKYIKSNLRFKKGSITDVPIEGRNIFDVIICFEALEHIDDYEELLKEVKRLLTGDGIFVVSTANKWANSDEPKRENPCHVHGLYLDEFTELFEKYFKQVKILGQRIYCNSNIWSIFPSGDSALSEYVIERTPREFAFVESDKRTPLYFIALASDADKNLRASASNLVDISNELLNQKDRAFAVARERLQSTIKSQQHALSEKDQECVHVATERERVKQEAARLRDTILAHQHRLAEKDQQIKQFAAEREQFAQQEAAQLKSTIEHYQQFAAEREQSAQLVQEQLKQFAAEREQSAQLAQQQLEQFAAEREQSAQLAQQQLEQFAAEREQSAQKIVELQEKLTSQREILARQEEELNSAVLKREHLGRQLAQLRVTLEQKLQELTEQETALLRIYQSHGWKALALYYRVRNGVFPEGTRRRVFAKKIFHAAVSMFKRRSVRKSIS